MYYDGTRLLSTKDINGNTPELFLCTTNRTGGKTPYFGRMVVNRFIKQQKKFCLIYRYKYELDDIADKFFKDIGSLFFQGWEMETKVRAKGVFHELYLTNTNNVESKVSCGYAIPLNSADQIKKYSHLFSDVDSMLFDEFQSETNNYCPDEITKFLSVHTSVARGQGKQKRYVPVYMLGNDVTLLNPYFVELGITDRINDETKFLKGDGFVLEHGFIESASLAQQESGIFKAFKNHKYAAYASQNVYLHDNTAFIEIPEKVSSRYLATIRYNECDYALREYRDLGIIYCDNHADKTFPMRISVTTEDHNINYVMLKANELFVRTMRDYFEHGCFRFKDLKCKQALLKCISY